MKVTRPKSESNEAGTEVASLAGARWRGAFAVLCTPFRSDGSVDWASLANEVQFCLEAGAHGLVCSVNGSESWTLTDGERLQATDTILEEVRGQVPVVVGVSAGSIEASQFFARQAEAAGADAVVAMPPPSRLSAGIDARSFYGALASAVGIPVMIQNADPPLGTRMSPETVASLVNDIPRVDWIKEETVPPGQAMGRELSLCGEKLQGVIGGISGRFILDEFVRGSSGTMPACESIDVHADIWDLLEAGHASEARHLFNRLLPLLNYSAHSMGVHKTVLKWRGIITSDYSRSAGGKPLDAGDLRELREIISSMADLFAVYPPK